MVTVQKTLAITSAVITGGLVIAWGITTGVVSGSRASANNRQKERDAILAPIVGQATMARVRIDDAVKAGKLDKEVGTVLKSAISAPSSNGANSSADNVAKPKAKPVFKPARIAVM